MTVGPDELNFDPRYPLEVDERVNVIVGYTRPPGAWRINAQPAPVTRTPAQLIREFATTWNTPEGESIVELMRRGNWISRGTKSPASIINGFKQVLATAQLRNESYEEVLASSMSQGAADIGRGAGGGPFRSETTSITEYDADSVAAIANNAYQNKLGRRATKKEREALAEILNQEQRRNPQVTISAGTTSGGTMMGQDGKRTARGTVSTTTTRGGIQPSELAEEQAIEAEDFEERFLVSTFTDMLKELSRPAV